MRLVPLLLVALLVAPSALAGSWPQEGHDAGRSYTTDEPGPAWGDVAWRVNLSGFRPFSGVPIVVGDDAFVPINEKYGIVASPGWVSRVRLDSGESETFASFPDRIQGMASDHERLFVVTETEIAALDVRTAERRWSLPVWQNSENVNQTFCRAPVLLEGVVHLQCMQENVSIPGTHIFENYLFALAIDGATGKLLWQWIHKWSHEIDGRLRRGLGVEAPLQSEFGVAINGASAAGPVMYMMVGLYMSPAGYGQLHIYALDRASGQLLWLIHSNTTADDAQTLHQYDIQPSHIFMPPAPRALPGVAYARLDELMALNPLTGYATWTRDVREDGGASLDIGGTALAGSSESLLVATQHTLRRFDLVTRAPVWSVALPPRLNWSPESLVETPRAVFGVASEYRRDGPRGLNVAGIVGDDLDETALYVQENDTLFAFDPADGRELWRYAFPTEQALGHHRFLSPGRALAVADDLLLTLGTDSELVAFGTTSVSPAPVARVSTEYPAPGTPVTVDLSGSAPGALGPIAWYTADWGDGSPIENGTGPVFSHTYVSAGEHVARFTVANADQSASTTLLFQVGGSPPTLVSRLGDGSAVLLASDHFWDVLGVASAVVVGLGGLFVRLRHRRRDKAALADAQAAQARDTYRAALARALASSDGRDAFDDAVLKALRERFRISEREHATMELEVRADAGGAIAVLAPGQLFVGKYRIERALGEGGFARAFLARDEKLDRRVVLKVARIESPREAKRALREARVLARLQHPRIVAIFDVEEVAGSLVLVLEHMPAGSLDDRLACDGPLPPEDALPIVEDVLAALEAAHAAGVVHRDVKPANILLDASGRAKLADFGIASTLAEGARGTATGMSLAEAHAAGTLCYMAPEQARGSEPDERTDIYAVGAALYAMVTGRSYLDLEVLTEYEARRAIIEDAPELPVPGLPDALNALLASALAKDPRDRPQTAAQMQRLVEALQNGAARRPTTK